MAELLSAVTLGMNINIMAIDERDERPPRRRRTCVPRFGRIGRRRLGYGDAVAALGGGPRGGIAPEAGEPPAREWRLARPSDQAGDGGRQVAQTDRLPDDD